MIVCHCNIITRAEVEAVVDRLLADDAYCILTPGRVYHRLGRRGRCCNCFPLIVKILVERGHYIRSAEEGMAPAAEECEDAEDRNDLSDVA